LNNFYYSGFAGEEWGRAIDDNLEVADVILLLVSPDFIAPDYCYDIEMKRAPERHDWRNHPDRSASRRS
jgi:hypothetical protein